MDDPQMELEQVGRKWRVVRVYPSGKRLPCTFPTTRKEAEWFLNQLHQPTENAIDEWVDIKIEAEQEAYKRTLEEGRPAKRIWARKARAEGRLEIPKYQPKMTKWRYQRLLELARQEAEEQNAIRDH